MNGLVSGPARCAKAFSVCHCLSAKDKMISFPDAHEEKKKALWKRGPAG
jgi:hypothetical protein